MFFPSYFPNSTSTFKEYFDGDKSPFFVPIAICIGEGFDHNKALSDFHSLLSKMVDTSDMNNFFPVNSHIDILPHFDIQTLKDRFGKIFEDLMRNLATAAYKKTEAHEPGKPSSLWIFGFPEVSLGEELFNQMIEHIKAAGVNAAGLLIGGAASRGGWKATLSLQGLATEGGKKVVENSPFFQDNSTNLMYAITPTAVLSDGGKMAFKAVDTVTDFVPIVGNVKSGANFVFNVYFAIDQGLEYRIIKKAEEELNKQIREKNKEIYEVIRSDFQRFLYNTDKFSELVYELRDFAFAKLLVNPHFNNPVIYKNKAQFSDHFAYWIKELYDDVSRLLKTIDKAREEKDRTWRALEIAKEKLADLEARKPNYQEPTSVKDRFYEVYRELNAIKLEKQHHFEIAWQRFNAIEGPSKEKICYLINIMNILRF